MSFHCFQARDHLNNRLIRQICFLLLRFCFVKIVNFHWNRQFFDCIYDFFFQEEAAAVGHQAVVVAAGHQVAAVAAGIRFNRINCNKWLQIWRTQTNKQILKKHQPNSRVTNFCWITRRSLSSNIVFLIRQIKRIY